MKKVEVVVPKGVEESNIYSNEYVRLEGEDLKVHDVHQKDGCILVVKDGDEELAVFHVWLYWKKIE